MFKKVPIIKILRDDKYAVDRQLLEAQKQLEYWRNKVPALEQGQRRLQAAIDLHEASEASETEYRTVPGNRLMSLLGINPKGN